MPIRSSFRCHGRTVGIDRLVALAAWLGCANVALAAGPAMWMVRLNVDGQKLEGAPISWSAQAIHLLGRDGRLWKLDPNRATDVQNAPTHFQSYSPSEFRAVLLRELGGDYEVSGTGHYLVAHPRGDGDKWAQRFEDLYRSFVRYFSVRGFQTVQPPFPLVAIVCRNQAEFKQHSLANAESLPNGVVGFYNPDSNRIMLYDMGAKSDSPRWTENASVLVHEATHQIAFNTGVHSRYAPPPEWLAEGLAMLFEASGVNDSRADAQAGDRVNHARLRAFQRALMPDHPPEALVALVASDDLFHINPGAAYAEAWALTFFLVETEPAKYASYLKFTASRPPFVDCTGAARVKDFVSVFGGDWRMLNAQFLRFIADLK